MEDGLQTRPTPPARGIQAAYAGGDRDALGRLQRPPDGLPVQRRVERLRKIIVHDADMRLSGSPCLGGAGPPIFLHSLRSRSLAEFFNKNMPINFY